MPAGWEESLNHCKHTRNCRLGRRGERAAGNRARDDAGGYVTDGWQLSCWMTVRLQDEGLAGWEKATRTR
jgi:hypothetical protein